MQKQIIPANDGTYRLYYDGFDDSYSKEKVIGWEITIHEEDDLIETHPITLSGVGMNKTIRMAILFTDGSVEAKNQRFSSLQEWIKANKSK